MPAYLLDTNHLSPLVTIGHKLREQVLGQIEEGIQFAVCVPVVTEMVVGISLLPRALQNRAAWRVLQPLFPCFPLDAADADVAAELRIDLRKRGWQLETVDALIAAVALRHDLTLLTTDRDFRAVPQLRTENWLQS